VAAVADALASYVPDRLVRRLLMRPRSAGQPHADRMVAALLLADISGFTAITERLAQQGPGGAEELRGLLDGAFGPLLTVIAETGGDVLKFAGDALLACWPAAGDDPDRGLAAATSQAAGCAQAMQAALQRYAATEELGVALRIGVGAGEVEVLDVGGVRERRELLVAGAAVPETTGAAGQAEPGQVVLSARAWSLVEAAAAGEPVPGGVRLRRLAPPARGTSPPPALPEDLGPMLAPYLPRAMLPSLLAGHEEWLAELRRITVLFVNLPDLDHRTGLDAAQPAMQALQTALYRFEGSINKLSVDDKGTTLVAALGLPPLTHEDDPARGVQAALAMHAALADLGLRAAVGVTTGRAFCGAVGNRRRREYTMLGAVVNMAARLMQEAGDGVLCDAATAEAARSAFAFEELPAVTVKGLSEPVPVHRPGRRAVHPGPSPTRPVPAPLIGREAERRRLAEALRRLGTAPDPDRPDRAAVVVLEGEAGVGKSRLVAELLAQAGAAGVRVLVCAGDAIERNTPWYPWRELFGRLPAFDGGDLAARRRAVLDLLGPDSEAGDLAPLLNAVLPLELPETGPSTELSGQGRADRTRDLLVRLVRAVVGDTPTVLVVEDGHWLDSASTGLVLALSRQRAPLLLVVASRPQDEAATGAEDVGWDAYRRLLRAPNTERLVLDPLSPSEVEALVCQRLGVASVPEVVTRLVQEKAEGNPLFSEELVFALGDAGLLRVVDGRGELAAGVGDVLRLRLPDTVHSAITSRIDRLTPAQQLSLKVASVIGRVFAVGILRDVHPMRETAWATLYEDLAVIERADMTVLDSPEPDLHYLFKHVITQEAAYNLMLLSQRRQLHRSVAEWYEQAHAGDLALLAHHWQGAEVPAKAIHYLERAGTQALREGAYQEAVRFFSALLELDGGTGGSAGPDPGDRRRVRRGAAPDVATIRRARWEHQLGDAYLGLGRLAPEQEHLHAALALLGRRTPASGRRLPPKLAWQVGQQVRNRLWPRPLVATSPEARAALLEAAECYERLFLVAYHASQRTRAVHQAVKGLNLAEGSGSASAVARLAASCAVSAGLLARHRLAEAYLRRAFSASSEAGDPAARAWVLQAAALYGIGVGRWGEVRKRLEEAAGIVRRLGDRRRLAEITGLASWELYFTGQFAANRALLADLDQLGRHSGDAQVRSWALGGQAVNGLRSGDLDAAALALQDRPASSVAAMLQLLRGDREAAAQGVREALGRAGPPPVKCYWFDLYAMTAEVALALWLDGRRRGAGDAGAWRSLAERAVHRLGRYARVFPIGVPRALLCRGLLAWAAGRPAPARRAWRDSLAAAERLGMRYDQALAHAASGRHGDPGQRPHHQATARQLFDQLGITDQTSPEALAARLAGLPFGDS
jgi:class 3 adenylate cyclase/tetratricopeptide (TPR) repeat protein